MGHALDKVKFRASFSIKGKNSNVRNWIVPAFNFVPDLINI